MNINSISNNNFKGIYISNSLNPGFQRELANSIYNHLLNSGLGDKFEKEGSDILLTKANNNGVSVILKPHDIKRILDDDYTRWSGRIFG